MVFMKRINKSYAFLQVKMLLNVLSSMSMYDLICCFISQTSSYDKPEIDFLLYPVMIMLPYIIGSLSNAKTETSLLFLMPKT